MYLFNLLLSHCEDGQSEHLEEGRVVELHGAQGELLVMPGHPLLPVLEAFVDRALGFLGVMLLRGLVEDLYESVPLPSSLIVFKLRFITEPNHPLSVDLVIDSATFVGEEGKPNVSVKFNLQVHCYPQVNSVI